MRCASHGVEDCASCRKVRQLQKQIDELEKSHKDFQKTSKPLSGQLTDQEIDKHLWESAY